MSRVSTADHPRDVTAATPALSPSRQRPARIRSNVHTPAHHEGNEEMDEQFTPEQVDDVEAHGLKEIAAGIAAVGAVSTGGAAMAAMSGPSIPPAPIVQQARDDVTTMAGHATGAANTLAGDAGRAANNTATNTVTAAHDVADPWVGFAQRTAADAQDTIDGTVAQSVGSIDRAVGDAGRLATSTANSAVSTVNATATTAQRTATKAVDTASATVRNTTATVDRTAASAAATAMTVVRTVQDLANHWTVNVGVAGAAAKAAGSLTNPSGTVTLTDSTGGVLASADIHDGNATLSFVTPAGGGTFTLHYPGDGLFGPTQLPLHLPPHAI
jgi:hypothetical protein